MIAINDIVLFRQRHSADVDDFVPDQNEYQRAAAPLFERHIDDSRSSGYGVPNAKRTMEFNAPASPHTPRQLDRRQKATAFRMTIRAEFRLSGKRQKIQPVPERGQCVSRLWPGDLDVERSCQRGHGRRRHQIRSGFGLPDPLLQVFEVQPATLA